jgi:methylated-DNA-[protein]-cysteine S-methyltransferase
MIRAAVTTSLGRFALTASERGLVSVTPAGAAIEAGAGRARSAPLEAPCAWLLAYAGGDPRPFGGALDLDGTEFERSVWSRLLAIPFGARETYGTLATALGGAATARAVGAAVAANRAAIVVPCHRVVGAGGTLTGYAWGLDLKRRLLAHESGHVAFELSAPRSRAAARGA